jgi:hypothetical protein
MESEVRRRRVKPAKAKHEFQKSEAVKKQAMKNSMAFELGIIRL